MQDYYNLVDVYLDAVLQPRCVTDPKTFAQEGWHYELDDAKAWLLKYCTFMFCNHVRSLYHTCFAVGQICILCVQGACAAMC